MTRIRVNGQLYGVNMLLVWRIAEGSDGMPDISAGEVTDGTTIKKVRDKVQELENALRDIMLGERVPLDVWHVQGNCVIIPAGKKWTPSLIKILAHHGNNWEIDPSPLRSRLRQIFDRFDKK